MALPRTSLFGYLLAGAVLLAAMGVVQIYVHRAERRELDAAEAAFVAATDETTALLRQRLDNYELVNRGGVSLFATVARPSRQQWEDYVAGLNLTRRFPALVGLGFAVYVSPGQLSDLQKVARGAGEGMFPVYPRGPREHYGAVLYLEPQTPANVATVGYDMYAEPVRQAAMQAAMDTGEPRLSGLVHLEQDLGKPGPAVQMFLPVYRAGDRPGSIAARREAMQGWIYAPFRVDDFVNAALRSTQRRARLRVVDITDRQEQVLYADPVQPEAGAFTRSTLLDAYGRRWRLDYESEPQGALESRMASLRTARVAGLFSALLLSLVILSLVCGVAALVVLRRGAPRG
ncbi:MAG: CHASE domain-containing protein, partial [Lysobacteraceae bacterium]